ncbi:MAG: EAL domain-containing protein [Pseudorhodoferax sp.]
MFIELVKSIALLLALCYLYSLGDRLHQPIAKKVFAGLLFGGICVVGMHTPLVLGPGAVIDARSVVLGMAGLFGGPLVACIAAAMACVARVWIGGVGAPVGVLVIFLCAALGLLYRRARIKALLTVTPLNLAGFGLFVHLGTVVVLQFLPQEIVLDFNKHLAVLYVITFTLTTILFGLLLRDLEGNLSAQRALKETAACLNAIAHAIPDVLLLLDERGRSVEVMAPEHAPSMTTTAQLVGKRLHEVMPIPPAGLLLALIRDTLLSGQMHCVEYEMPTSRGTRHFEGRIQPLGILANGLRTVIFLARDITERKQSETALRESELRFRSLLRNVPSISVQGYRNDGTATYWNKASERLYGYSEQEALGQNLLDLIIPTSMREAVHRNMQQMFSSGRPIPAGEFQFQHKDGSLVDVFSSHMLIEVPEQPPEIFCIDIDISRIKTAENEARYLAFYDSLTGLPNRRLLMERLQQAIANSVESGHPLAVMFVDLDNFKTLNDTRGHAVGDLLLQQVADRLRNGVRQQDMVARLGGDEFVVILEDLGCNSMEAIADVRQRGEAILAQLRQPCSLATQNHCFSASIGVSIVDDPGVSLDEILQQADMAMYRAKDKGRNTLCFFDPEMQRALNRRALLETELHNGLRESQFKLLYQAQVNREGHVTGAEVLVRWHHPAHGLVAPSEFIPLAEESGLILSLGNWIMEEALHQQARWRHDPQFQSLNLSINVSSRQFLHESFVPQTIALLESTGADPRRIKLEITESFLLQSVEGAATTMRALQAYGLQFSLDDFGTGYSSLSYLKRLPLSEIKIDQDFVRGVLQDTNDAFISQSIIELAVNLGLHVIAEGVETIEHYLALLDYGCPAFQGYFFARPMALQDFQQHVAASNAKHAGTLAPMRN